MFQGVKKIEDLQKGVAGESRIAPEDRGKVAESMKEWRQTALKKGWRKKDEFDYEEEKEEMKRQIEGWKK